jgi:histidyl-tRNA synthetase
MEHLPGFRDFYPEPVPHQDVWSADVRNHVFNTWRDVARRYGFREYDGPPLEPLELYTTKSGDEIVGQLYNFTDKGGRELALRPEMTPTLARMVAAHGRNYKKPIKWFAIPQLFRYERQQKGRLREHFQLNADIFGENDPAADAELIALLIDSLRALRLTADDFVIRLSSRNAWHDFFQQNTQSPGAGNRGPGSDEYAFYQVIDKLEREDPAQSDARLKALGFSLDAVKSFIAAATPTAELDAIRKNLDARGLGEFVKIDYNVIRGLAYYTGPVFEAFDRKGEFRAIAGGGRYDNLVKLISGGKVDLPGLGFGMGDVVLTELLTARGLLPNPEAELDVFFVIENEADRSGSLRLVQELRNAGCSVEYSLVPSKPDKQLKRGVELGARFSAKIENGKFPNAQVRLRDIRTRQEQVVPQEQVLSYLRLEVSRAPAGS